MKKSADDKQFWSKWFWSDWRGDEKLMLVSYSARGVWMELLSIIATSPVPGHLLLETGKPPTDRELLKLTRGDSMKELQACLAEIKTQRVCDVRDGVIVSRRIEREARKSAIAKQNGDKGGNPLLLARSDKRQLQVGLTKPDNQIDKPRLDGLDNTQIPEPDLDPEKENPLTPFEAFWAAYPSGPNGKQGKQAALKAWDKLEPDAVVIDAIHAALSWQVCLPEWVKERGQYIPRASTYLNGRRWEDKPPSGARSAGPAFDEQLLEFGTLAGMNRHNAFTWLSSAELTWGDDGVVTLAFGDEHARAWVDKHHRAGLEEVARKRGWSQLAIVSREAVRR